MKYCDGIPKVRMLGFVGKAQVKVLAFLVKGRETMSASEWRRGLNCTETKSSHIPT
jgi:hypothetical protein